MKKKIRNLKIASVLHRAISKILMEGNFLDEKVVVSNVEVSKDLKKANVYVILSSLNIQNYDTDISSVVNEINQSAWSIRKSVFYHVDLKFIPELVFRPDLMFNNFINSNRILHNST